MELNLTNGERPPEALQYAMGRALPPLTDEQCAEFAALVDEHGGAPFGWPAAQDAFRGRYEADVQKGRWVK